MTPKTLLHLICHELGPIPWQQLDLICSHGATVPGLLNIIFICSSGFLQTVYETPTEAQAAFGLCPTSPWFKKAPQNSL